MMRIKYIGILLLSALSAVMYGQTKPNVEKSDSKIKLNGKVALYSNYSTTSDSLVSVNPFGYGITIAPVLRAYNYSLPFTFTYSNGSSNYNTPFLRFGVAPTFKWGKFYLGNNTINFSRFVLNGLNCFGIGAETNVKGLYFGVFSGQLSKKFVIDSTASKFNTISQRYQSKGLAFKAGVKTKSTKILFTYLQAHDVEQSLAYINPKIKLAPRANKALGSEISFKMGDHVSLSSQTGMTILTRNVNAPNLDTLLRNSGEKELPSYAKLLEKNPNVSSFVAFGFENQLSFDFTKFGIDFRQKRIQPDYQTLGQRFENNDILQYTVEPSFKLLSNKLNINLSGGIQKNNLSKKRLTQQTNRIYSCNMSYTPSNKFYLSINYSNYGVQFGSSKVILDDSLSIRNINSNLSLNTAYYLVQDKDGSKSISLNINRSNTTESYELNPLKNSNFNNLYANVNYSFAMKERMSYTLGANYNNATSQIRQLGNELFDIVSYGLNGNVTKPLLNKKNLTINIGGNLNFAGEAKEKKKLAMGLNSTLNYSLSKRSNLNFGWNINRMTITNRKINQISFFVNIQNSL